MSYSNFIRLQNFVAHCLSSYDALDNVNIITRSRLLQSESLLPDKTLALEVLAYITPRNGRKGLGVIVERPGFTVESPNLPGPEGFITLELLILCDRLTNEGPQTGTGLAADQCGQLIMEALHWQQFEGFGQLFSDRNAMQAAEDWAPLDAYRLRFKIRMPRNQGEKTAQPTITENTGSITLACSTSGAQIYYTTDQSYPGRSNPAAKLYEAPFTATAGDVINAAAYASGYTPSHMIQATVT